MTAAGRTDPLAEGSVFFLLFFITILLESIGIFKPDQAIKMLYLFRTFGLQSPHDSLVHIVESTE